MPSHPELVGPKAGILEVFYGKEAASQAAVAGNLGYLSATGLLTEVATAGVAIAGIFLEACSGTTSAAIKLLKIQEGDEVAFSVIDGSDDSDFDTASLVAGEAYGIKVLDSVTCADKNNTTNKALIFLRAVPPLPGESASYRGIFRVVTAANQWATPA